MKRSTIENNKLEIIWILLLIAGLTTQQYLKKEVTLADFQAVIPDIKRISSMNRFRNSKDMVNTFTVFFKNSAGEDKVTYIHIDDDTGHLNLIGADGQETGTAFIRTTQPTDFSVERYFNYNHNNFDHALMSLSLDSVGKRIRGYYQNFDEVTLPELESIDQNGGKIFLSRIMTNWGEGGVLTFFAQGNKITSCNIRSNLGPFIFNYCLPSAVEPTVGNLVDVTFAVSERDYVYAAFVGDTKETLAFNFKFSDQHPQDNKGYKVIKFGDMSDLECEKIKGYSTYQIICINNQQQLEVYEINPTLDPPDNNALKQQKQDAITLKSYLSIEPFPIQNPDFHEQDIHVVLGVGMDGKKGAYLIGSTGLDLIHFIEIEELDLSDQIHVFDYLTYFINYDKQTVTIYKFGEYTGIENCSKNETPNKFMSQSCGLCSEGFQLDNSTPLPWLCVSMCPRNTKYVSGACVSCETQHSCLDCDYLEDICYLCKDRYLPLEPYVVGQPLCYEAIPDCRRNLHTMWNGEECFDCLQNRNCLDCHPGTGDCNSCSENHHLDPEGDGKVCRPCSFFIDRCLECDSPKACKRYEDAELLLEDTRFVKGKLEVHFIFNRNLDYKDHAKNSKILITSGEESFEIENAEITLKENQARILVVKIPLPVENMPEDGFSNSTLILDFQQNYTLSSTANNRTLLYPNQELHYSPFNLPNLNNFINNQGFRDTVKGFLATSTALSTLLSPTMGLTMIKMPQFINLLDFINIDYPVNLARFLDLFSNSLLEMFSGLFTNLLIKIWSGFGRLFSSYEMRSIEDEIGCRPLRIVSGNDMGCLFIPNSGGLVLQGAFFGIVKGVVWSILKGMRGKGNRVSRVVGWLDGKLGFRFFGGFFMAAQIDLLIAIFVNLRNAIFRRALGWISAIMAITGLVFYIYFIGMVNIKIAGIKPKEGSEDGQKGGKEEDKSPPRWNFLVEGLQKKYQESSGFSLGKQYMGIQAIKDFLYPFLIIVFIEIPGLQIIPLVILLLKFATLTCIYRPFDSILENVRTIFLVIADLLISIFLKILWIFGNSWSEKQKQDYIGTPVIWCIILTTAGMCIIGLFESMMMIKHLIRKLKGKHTNRIEGSSIEKENSKKDKDGINENGCALEDKMSVQPIPNNIIRGNDESLLFPIKISEPLEGQEEIDNDDKAGGDKNGKAIFKKDRRRRDGDRGRRRKKRAVGPEGRSKKKKRQKKGMNRGEEGQKGGDSGTNIKKKRGRRRGKNRIIRKDKKVPSVPNKPVKRKRRKRDSNMNK